MRKGVAALVMAAIVVMGGCGAQQAASPELSLDSGGDAFAFGDSPSGIPDYQLKGPAGPAGAMGRDGAVPAPYATPAPARPEAPNQARAKGQESAEGGSGGGAFSLLQVTGRKVIASGSLSLEVQAVQPAISQVRAIAEGAGGFIEQLSSSGGAERQHSTITIRVPQPEFFNVLERVQALGKVQGQNIGSDDVSDQYVDLEARLKSAQRQEESFLSLLSKATSVSDILTIERELARVRAEIERVQGQLSFLDRRVELATISISLLPPGKDPVTPPDANLTVAVKDVSLTASEVKGMVATMNGVIESSGLLVKDGRERAAITFRVFSADFERAMAALEGKGEVKRKDVREGGTPAADAPKPEKPDARIQVQVIEPEPRQVPWDRILIGGGIFLGVIGMAIALYALTRGLRRRPVATA